MRTGTWTRADMATRRIEDLGHLAELLGGSVDSFTGDLLRLIIKAQQTPSNFIPLRGAFPREVLAWEVWNLLADPTGNRVMAAVDCVESGTNAGFLEGMNHVNGRMLIRSILVEDLDEQLREVFC